MEIAEEWIPEIGRVDDVVEEWKRQGFDAALATLRLSRQAIIGVSDGPQKGQRGAYGWVMQTLDRVLSSSGKVTSYTRELDSYRAELHGVLSMMTGAWEVD